MPQPQRPSTLEYLRARAAVARSLVRAGRLQPDDALAFAVWPTADITEAEGRVPRGTIACRAYLPRMNQ